MAQPSTLEDASWSLVAPGPKPLQRLSNGLAKGSWVITKPLFPPALERCKLTPGTPTLMGFWHSFTLPSVASEPSFQKHLHPKHIRSNSPCSAYQPLYMQGSNKQTTLVHHLWAAGFIVYRECWKSKSYRLWNLEFPGFERLSKKKTNGLFRVIACSNVKAWTKPLRPVE